MTTQDKELFDLCKQVYEATGWKGARDLYFNSAAGWVPDFGADVEDAEGALEDEPGDWIPLYNSDYLMDNLPPVIQDPYDKKFKHIQMWINGDGPANAGYVEPYAHDDRVAYAQESNEMRKTLLKLTLALKEEGLL